MYLTVSRVFAKFFVYEWRRSILFNTSRKTIMWIGYRFLLHSLPLLYLKLEILDFHFFVLRLYCIGTMFLALGYTTLEFVFPIPKRGKVPNRNENERASKGFQLLNDRYKITTNRGIWERGHKTGVTSFLF